MANLFGNDLSAAVSTENGPILSNIANQAVVTESVLTLLPDDTVTAVHISPYGKSILNETSVSSLRNKILEADTAIEITDNGVGEINFDVDNVLKMQVTSASTKINNNLLVDTIKRNSDSSDAISLGTTTMTLQKPMTIFRDSTNYGYMRIQNSVNTKSGYIDWVTGSGLRVAYLGLGDNNNGVTKINNSLTLGLENQCGFSINDATTPIFKVSIENDTIDLNYLTNANGNFIMKDDSAHKEINNNNNLLFLKVPRNQN